MKQENNKVQEKFVLQRIDSAGIWVSMAVLLAALYFNIQLEDIKEELIDIFLVFLPIGLAPHLIDFISLFVKNKPEWLIVLKRRVGIISLRGMCLVMPFIILCVVLNKAYQESFSAEEKHPIVLENSNTAGYKKAL